MKCIGKIGGTNAVYGHFIERPENLQGTAEGVIGIQALGLVRWLWCGGGCALGGQGDGDGYSTEGTEFIPSRRCLWNDPFPVVSIRKGLGRVMGGNEQGSEVPESLEVGLTAFFKLVS